MANSCRSVPELHSSSLREAGKKELRKTKRLLDCAGRHLGEETAEDEHGRGRKDRHNG